VAAGAAAGTGAIAMVVDVETATLGPVDDDLPVYTSSCIFRGAAENTTAAGAVAVAAGVAVAGAGAVTAACCTASAG
jgi:hypothetical protein